MNIFSDPWVARARGLGPVKGFAQGPVQVKVVPVRTPMASAPAPTLPRAVPAAAPPRLAAPAAPSPPASPMSQAQQPVPMGNKASCPVCRTFGGR